MRLTLTDQIDTIVWVFGNNEAVVAHEFKVATFTIANQYFLPRFMILQNDQLKMGPATRRTVSRALPSNCHVDTWADSSRTVVSDGGRVIACSSA
jgi:hypothetical protein